MSNLWEEEPEVQTRTKKQRPTFKKKSDRSPESSKTWIIPSCPEHAQAGTVSSIHKNALQVLFDGQFIETVFAEEIPVSGWNDFAVGDQVWVVLGAEMSASVVGRRARTSFVGRTKGDRTRQTSAEWYVLAANVDCGLITVPLEQADVQAPFIDRYLVLLQDGGVQPVVCLTKSDQSTTRPTSLDFYVTQEIPVFETSTLSGEGIRALKEYISKKVVVFVGQSGAGKSSLMNAIDPSLELATQIVNAKTGKGKHTTTRSNLYQWAEGSFIIDTPGIRSLGVEDIPKEEVRFLFPEFSALSTNCRYRNCSHLSEPACAVKKSLELADGVIKSRRYESYVRMMKE